MVDLDGLHTRFQRRLHPATRNSRPGDDRRRYADMLLRCNGPGVTRTCPGDARRGHRPQSPHRHAPPAPARREVARADLRGTPKNRRTPKGAENCTGVIGRVSPAASLSEYEPRGPQSGRVDFFEQVRVRLRPLCSTCQGLTAVTNDEPTRSGSETTRAFTKPAASISDESSPAE